MKKLIFAAFCFLFFNYGHGQSVSCSDFNISVGYGPFSVSTTVYVCCGGPFMIYPNPCSVVTKRTYNLWTQQHNTSTAANKKGIKAEELLGDPKIDISKLDYLEITQSDTKKMENGETIKIKIGKYPIDKDGYVYLELETL